MKLVPVLMAGGGSVAMTLACELSRRGIACMLVERNATTTRYPKMDITNARSMELFRRLKLVEALRSLTVYELHRFRYPSVNEWRRLIFGRKPFGLQAQGLGLTLDIAEVA